MDPATNPYAPGAGTRPPLLAGRDDLVATATLALSRAQSGRHAKSFVAVGLRGVGKTVVLNKVHELAQAQEYHVASLEARDDSSLVNLLVPRLRTILLAMSRSAQAAEAARRGLAVLKNFANALHVQIGEIAIGFDFHEETGIADSGSLETDLPDLLATIGEVARTRNTAVAILIDEIQYLSQEELSAVIMAMHHISQQGLPIVLVAAGLPPILGKMGQSKSCAERLFDFPRIGALNQADACRAIAEPAEAQNIRFTTQALAEIFSVTEGYPYFLQEWGFVTWNLADRSPIERHVVVRANQEAIRRLDESFFRVRLERMSRTERRYMRAMAELGVGPHTSGDIARVYGAKVTTVAPTRSTLISKGMLYNPSYGMTDFTVPLFDQFLRREMPNWHKGEQEDDE
jgi:AAA ATPase domain